ncbi:putative reverse transcriptase domain-containing protein [Tanacetum coccineum]
MDFVTKLPRTAAGFYTIWVIVDRLTKSAHFLPMKETDLTEKLARLYFKEVVSRYEIIHETTEKIFKIIDRMQAVYDQQKSYADKRRRLLEFGVGDKVMLNVESWKGVVRFGKHGKLNPRYIRPFKIIEKIGPVAYRLELPQELSRVHNVFHVCNLKKCLSDDTLVIPLEEIQLDDKFNFVEEPVEIMDREVKQLKRSHIPIVKVCWNARRGPEYTWEREDQFKSKYPYLFANPQSPKTSIGIDVPVRLGLTLVKRIQFHLSQITGVPAKDTVVVSSPAVDEHVVAAGNTKDVNVGQTPISYTVDPN